jgi:hypothetical protein
MVPAVAAILALTVSAFVPCGPHVLTHALDIRHVHQHEDVADEHDHDAAEHHEHEFQLSPDGARIAAAGVQLPRPVFTSFIVGLPPADRAAALAPIIVARGLDPPRPSLSPHLAALCCGNKAPPTA